jgi:hypothetical protein
MSPNYLAFNMLISAFPSNALKLGATMRLQRWLAHHESEYAGCDHVAAGAYAGFIVMR